MKVLNVLVTGLFLFAVSGVINAQEAKRNEIATTVIFVRENPHFTRSDFRYNKSTDQFGGAFSFTRFAKSSPIGLNFEVADSATGSSATDANLLTATVGVIVKSRTSKFCPFIRANVGLSRLASRNNLLKFDKSDSGFAAVVGGGLDVRLSKKLALRLIEVDYVGSRILGSTVSHARASTGLVFNF